MDNMIVSQLQNIGKEQHRKLLFYRHYPLIHHPPTHLHGICDDKARIFSMRLLELVGNLADVMEKFRLAYETQFAMVKNVH